MLMKNTAQVKLELKEISANLRFLTENSDAQFRSLIIELQTSSSFITNLFNFFFFRYQENEQYISLCQKYRDDNFRRRSNEASHMQRKSNGELLSTSCSSAVTSSILDSLSLQFIISFKFPPLLYISCAYSASVTKKWSPRVTLILV